MSRVTRRTNIAVGENAALLRLAEVGLRPTKDLITNNGYYVFGPTGSLTQVPDNHTAKLMYYLNSICVLLDLSDQTNLERLRLMKVKNTRVSNNKLMLSGDTDAIHQLDQYGGLYNRLSEEETNALVVLCLIISPDELIGKVMFPNDAMCGDRLNEFYQLSAVRSSLLVSESVVIGGNTRRVAKIMTFKQPWIVKNWITPMEHFRPRLQRLLAKPKTNDCCCTIL